LIKAQTMQHYHVREGEELNSEMAIDPRRFVEVLNWNKRMLDYEDEVMSHLPHLRLQYEDDLRGAAMHQPTVDRICSALEIAPHPVKATLVRTGGEGGRVRVTNMDELKEAALTAGFQPVA
jgi:hypothetical protein